MSVPAWETEPDEERWVDDATGYQCRMLRGPMGSPNGYVGIPADHPLHGKKCSDTVQLDEAELKRLGERPTKDTDPIIPIFCLDHDEFRAGRVPIDVLIDVHGGITFAKEVNGLWTFGFDTAHSGDLMPKHEGIGCGETYRDWSYVKEQTTKMAAQLHAIAKAEGTS